MLKRLLSLFLALALLASFSPMTVLAAGEEETVETMVHINPLYQDVLTEEDLNKTSGDPRGSTKSTYFGSIEAAAAEVRKQMVARADVIHVGVTFPTEVTGEIFSDACTDIFDLAVSHTGNGKEGDYLLWQYGGWGLTGTYSGCNLDLTYEMTYFTTAAQEAQVDSKVSSVLSGLNLAGKTDYQIVSAIYDYICDNVVYDYDNLNNPDYMLKHSAYAALINGTSVCQGYAVLFYRMALDMGVDCRYISGYGNGGAHGWNIVKVGDLYYNLDATWDAGADYYDYFLRCDDNFTDHAADDEFTTADFKAKYPKSAVDYTPESDTPSVPNDTIASGTCGDNITWVLTKDRVLTISGAGEMDNFDLDQAPWYDVRYQINSVVIEKGITYIGSHTFQNCERMTSVSIPEGVTQIGYEAFYKCSALESLNLPSTLKSIGSQAFAYCDTLTGVTVPDGVTEINWGAFSDCENLTSASLPDSATDLSSSIFADCKLLKDVRLPSNMTKIPEGMFSGCTGLSSIDIPDTVTSIGPSAFSGCSSLKEIDLPESLTVIHSGYWHQGAFRGCTSLTSISFPAKLTAIEGCAFQNCTALRSITFNDILYSIGDFAFDGCDSLTEVTIPESVVFIGNNAFSGKTLNNIHVDADNYDYISVDGVLFNKKMTQLLRYPQGRSGAYDIPNTVTSIGSYAFYECQNLTGITIPGSVRTIGQSAFSYCSGLEKIIIPEGVTTINSYGFNNSADIFALPVSLTSVGDSVFTWPDIVYYAGTETQWNQITFGAYNYFDDTTIYYNTTGPVVVESGTCGQNLTWTLDSEGTLVISGSGKMTDYASYENNEEIAPWRGLDIQVTNVVIESGVTSIGSFAFYICNNVKAVTMPDTIRTIGSNAFYGCHSLKEITIPKSVTAIEYNAFGHCDELTITFQGKAPVFDESAFWYSTITANYPAGDRTWTESVRKNYGGTVTWLPYGEGHAYTAVVTAPTCTEQGYTTYTCSCGDSYKDNYTNALGHTFEVCAGKDPTCTEAGMEQYACVVCWDSAVTYEKTVPALGHDYKIVGKVNPTATTEGYSGDQVCSRCSHTIAGYVIPAGYVKPNFSDLEPGAYYVDYVYWAHRNGLTAGYPDGTFAPHAPCTRAQVMVFLWAANGRPAAKISESPFSDVKPGDWYYDAVMWAVGEKFTAGSGNGKFGVNETVTRADFMMFLWGAEGRPTATIKNNFNDVRDTDYYTPAILWAVENKITAGTPGGGFSPKALCTRAQVVTFLHHVYCDVLP